MAVTDRISGLNIGVAIKPACYVAATANISLSGTQVVDGLAVGSCERVLVGFQTDSVDNGIYVSDSGDWSRASDCDGSRDIIPGSLVYVDRGTAYARTLWVFNSSSTETSITVDTDDITLSQSEMSFAGVSSWIQTNLFPVTSSSSALSVIGAVSSTQLIVPSTYIEENVFPIVSWSSMKSFLDPLDQFEISGDGLTDDTTRFTDLESAYSGRIIDLRGLDHRVTSIPTGNKYINGYWNIANADGPLTVNYPAKQTIQRGLTTLESGTRMTLHGGAGNMHLYNDILFMRYMEGLTDSDTDTGTGAVESYDWGHSWHGWHLVVPGDASTGINNICSGIVHGQWLTVVRYNTDPVKHKLFGCRTYERREDCILSCTISSGSSTMAVKFSTAQNFLLNGGFKTGDRVNIINPSATVAGITLGNTYTMSAVGLAIAFPTSALASTTVSESTISADVTFIQDPWAELIVESTDFDEALAAETGSTGITTCVGQIVVKEGERGTFYVCANDSGANGTAIYKVKWSLTNNSSVSFGRFVYNASTASEIMLTRDSSGAFFGWIRTQNKDTTPQRFFYSASEQFDSSDTVVTGQAFGNQCLPAMTLVNDNTLWCVTHNDRVTSTSTAERTGLYLGTQRTSDAIVHGATGFRWTYLTELYYDPNSDTGDNNTPIGQAGIAAPTTNLAVISFTDNSPTVRPGLPNLAGSTTWRFGQQTNIRMMHVWMGTTDDYIPNINYNTTQTFNSKSTVPWDTSWVPS